MILLSWVDPANFMEKSSFNVHKLKPSEKQGEPVFMLLKCFWHQDSMERPYVDLQPSTSSALTLSVRMLDFWSPRSPEELEGDGEDSDEPAD